MESNRNVSAGWLTTPNEIPESDFVLRLRIDERQPQVFGAMATADFVDEITRMLRQLQTLGSVVDVQKRQLDYQGHYNAFLLGLTSEEDFNEVSDEFTVETGFCDPDILRFQIKTVTSYCKSEFDSSDFADFFSCPEEDAVHALQQLELALPLPEDAEI